MSEEKKKGLLLTKEDMQKAWGISFLIVIVGGAWIAISNWWDETKSEPVYTTTLEQLTDDYNTNEVATQEKIKGKIVRLTGTVQSIDEGFGGGAEIKLDTDNMYLPAEMDLRDSQKAEASRLVPGQNVTLDCREMNRSMGYPSGDECTIVQTP